MRKISLFILFLVIYANGFSQTIDFENSYRLIISDDSYKKTLDWLEDNRENYDRYMNGCPLNIVSIAYDNEKYQAMDAAIIFDKKLLDMFIKSCAGGHASTPPTIFTCLRNNDIKYVDYFLKKGVPVSITWEIIAELPQNLFSMAQTNEMRTLLRKYHCPEFVEVNNYICEINDSNVNVRDNPGINGKKIFKVNIGDKGKLTRITSYEEIISGNKNKWYFIIFENGKSGWIFGQFVHVFWLDGM